MGVSGDEEVDVAVAVVIAPGSAGHKAAAADAGFFGDVFKFAVAKIAVQNAAGIAGDEKIELAVVVIVSDGNAHAPTFAGQAGCGGQVLEAAVWLLMLGSDHGIAALAGAGDGGYVYENDAEPARVNAIDKT